MQIGSKFTIAVHILTAIDYFNDKDRVGSEFLAGSVGVNPVVVRTVISQFRAMTDENPKATYACLNYNEAFCPKQIEKRSVCLDKDAGALLD